MSLSLIFVRKCRDGKEWNNIISTHHTDFDEMAFVQKFKISANGNVAYSIGKVCGNLGLRPLTRGGGPCLASLSNRAASVDARHLLPGRRVEQTSC